ncbi:hypothetical protein DSO57_1010067 [Entomophthora muscae]|uniref:Uncharacterized protein n=1 Tax=Entomophthora muscae TaxID=34485 RepID=A0ACC2SJQ2_9FUNG|nr:hypothetical protein DSO57_1010067 [Entomophthora muscae]
MSTSADGTSDADLAAELLRLSKLGFLPLHKCVISRLISLSPDQFEIISGTYYTRWKEGKPEERQEIEKLGLLDFLEKELLLPSPLASKLAGSEHKRPDSRSVAKFLKDFWNPFLDNRDSDVEELIFQQFRIPIHRYSQVANAIGKSSQ